jgi:hypothetical protein
VMVAQRRQSRPERTRGLHCNRNSRCQRATGYCQIRSTTKNEL